jgi:hypothetical protein
MGSVAQAMIAAAVAALWAVKLVAGRRFESAGAARP